MTDPRAQLHGFVFTDHAAAAQLGDFALSVGGLGFVPAVLAPDTPTAHQRIGLCGLDLGVTIAEVEAIHDEIERHGLGFVARLEWWDAGTFGQITSWAVSAHSAVLALGHALEAGWPRPEVVAAAAGLRHGDWPAGEERVAPGTTVTVSAPSSPQDKPRVWWQAGDLSGLLEIDAGPDWEDDVRHALDVVTEGLGAHLAAEHVARDALDGKASWTTDLGDGVPADVRVAPVAGSGDGLTGWAHERDCGHLRSA